MDDILAKLASLRALYPTTEDQELFSDWEKKAKLAVMTSNLKENDAVKIIIENYRKELLTLDKMLTTDEALFKDQAGLLLGQTIHARKKWCKRFLQIFDTASSQVSGFNNMADNYISNA